MKTRKLKKQLMKDLRSGCRASFIDASYREYSRKRPTGVPDIRFEICIVIVLGIMIILSVLY